jgi:hypothetical protein
MNLMFKLTKFKKRVLFLFIFNNAGAYGIKWIGFANIANILVVL